MAVSVPFLTWPQIKLATAPATASHTVSTTIVCVAGVTLRKQPMGRAALASNITTNHHSKCVHRSRAVQRVHNGITQPKLVTASSSTWFTLLLAVNVRRGLHCKGATANALVILIWLVQTACPAGIKLSQLKMPLTVPALLAITKLAITLALPVLTVLLEPTITWMPTLVYATYLDKYYKKVDVNVRWTCSWPF